MPDGNVVHWTRLAYICAVILHVVAKVARCISNATCIPTAGLAPVEAEGPGRRTGRLDSGRRVCPRDQAFELFPRQTGNLEMSAIGLRQHLH